MIFGFTRSFPDNDWDVAEGLRTEGDVAQIDLQSSIIH